MAKLNTGTSIVDYLKSQKKDYSYDNRKLLAEKYGISGYRGSNEQNTLLLNKLKSGPSENEIIDIPKLKPLKKINPDNAGLDMNDHIIGDTELVPSNNKPQTLSIDDYKAYTQNTPQEYQSPYSKQIANILNQIQSGQQFSYNINTDPLYQQYAEQAMRNGNLAMRDTMGNAAVLTGGYGSSYGTTVGSQAYDAYMQSLNEQIPALQQNAYQQYQDKLNNQYNQLSALQGAEQNDYSKYRDLMNDYYNNRDFNYNKGIDERNYNYQVGRDSVSDNQWQTQYDRGVYEDNRNYDYQVGRDKVSDNQWQSQFDYGKKRDSISDSQWQKQYNHNVSQDAINNSQQDRQFVYNQQQDKLNREDAKTEYFNKLAQNESEAAAKESEKRINTYSSNVDKMLNSTTEDTLGNKTNKYSAKDAWDYLSNSGLSDDEIAIIANDNYELRKYLEGMGSKGSYSSGGGKY